MIKILIIEDEIPARKKLKRFIEEQPVPNKIVAEITNIVDAVKFLKNSSVDLIFSDIELLDGNAFEIYKRVSVSCPIIFTTAYDEFMMKAFDCNGIAYLLKPFSKVRFQKAWDKFILFRNPNLEENMQLINLTKLIENNLIKRAYKKRFTLHTQHGFSFIDMEVIAYFAASNGVIFAFDCYGKKHLLRELTLKEIEEQLNPQYFFRINRGELINKQYVERIERYSKNILSIKMKYYTNHLKTSHNNTAAFREWIEK